MRGLQNPVGVLGINNRPVSPFDLKMAGCSFDEWWPRETVHIESGLRRHSCEATEENKVEEEEVDKDR